MQPAVCAKVVRKQKIGKIIEFIKEGELLTEGDNKHLVMLLYYLVEYLATNREGNIVEVLELAKTFSTLLSAYQKDFYATLIRILVNDIRLVDYAVPDDTEMSLIEQATLSMIQHDDPVDLLKPVFH